MTASHVQTAMARTMREIYARSLTTLSGGNLSHRAGDDIWITPSGVDKGELRAEDMVLLRDGVAQGHPQGRRPSSEYPFHLAIYAARPDVQVILHAHVPALVAYCIAHQTPDTRLVTDVHSLCGDIGYAPYANPGTPELGAGLAQRFAEGYQVVLMENHGVVTVGATLRDAYARLEASALVAQAALHARALGHAALTAPERAPSIASEPGAIVVNDENLAKWAQRACRQGLLLAHLGWVAQRAKEGWHITQGDHGHGTDSALIRRLAYVSVRDEVLFYAHPPHLMAYAVSGARLDTRTIPEAYVTLKAVPLVDDEVEAIKAAFDAGAQALIVRQRGVLVSGNSLTAAYDRLEVLEYAARSALEAQRLGGFFPLSEAAIADLDHDYAQRYRGLDTDV